jgi:hypothetical protein
MLAAAGVILALTLRRRHVDAIDLDAAPVPA